MGAKTEQSDAALTGIPSSLTVRLHTDASKQPHNLATSECASLYLAQEIKDDSSASFPEFFNSILVDDVGNSLSI